MDDSTNKHRKSGRQSRTSGELIQAGGVYTRPQVMDALGWGRKVWTHARKNGLKVIKVGFRMYVTGEEVIRYMKTLQEK